MAGQAQIEICADLWDGAMSTLALMIWMMRMFLARRNRCPLLPEFDHPAPQHEDDVKMALPAKSRDRTTARHHKVAAVGGACALAAIWRSLDRLIIAVRARSPVILIYVYVANWETSRDLKRVGFKPELSGSR